jgi:hypothetical protein
MIENVESNLYVLLTAEGSARGRLRNALIADSDDFAPIMGGGRFQLQTEDQESGAYPSLPRCCTLWTALTGTFSVSL